MLILRRVCKHARFTRELTRFCRSRLSLERAQQILAERLARREESFVEMAKQLIFGNPRSPYLPLLRNAGCELGDLEREVRIHGLEATLARLSRAGVGVSFEEFKGKVPMVRDGATFSVRPEDFDNPIWPPIFMARSGGTTGPGTSVPANLQHLSHQLPNALLHYHAHGLSGAPAACWFGVLPDTTGLYAGLRLLPMGERAERWFVPAEGRDLATTWRDRLVTRYTILVTRLVSPGIPRPEPVDYDEAARIARWMREALDREGRCVLRTHVSKGLRVALAALEEGIDLSGGAIVGVGEPPTPSKVEGIQRSGARLVATYHFAEGGALGLGCARPTDPTDLHFFTDSFALIQEESEVPGVGRVDGSFRFTSLLPTAPKVLLNVDIDDYGIAEARECGCELGRAGFTVHLRQIASARKLTGEGVTLAGSDMIRILEEVLPRRFGGSSLDYQVVEEEDERGMTRLTLLVSPEVPLEDESAPLEVVRQELRKGGRDGAMTERVWRDAGALRVRRQRPIWTSRGKLMPLHAQRR